MPRHNKIDHERADAIKEIFYQKKTRGRRQVQMQLQRQYGIHMSLGSVHRYMSILNIKSIRKRKYVPQKKQEQKLAHSFPNVLQQEFCPSPTTEKWLTDITYIPSRDGTLYLSCIKDVRDKSIISYHYSDKNNNELVIETLRKSIPLDLYFHTLVNFTIWNITIPFTACYDCIKSPERFRPVFLTFGTGWQEQFFTGHSFRERI